MATKAKKTFTINDFIGMANKLSLAAFNNTNRGFPNISVTLPNGDVHFVNRERVNNSYYWVLGPKKRDNVAKKVEVATEIAI